MEIINLEIPEVKLITPQIFKDSRGSFEESYTFNKFEELGINHKFIQDNYSISKVKGTIRGLHFQTNPMAQTKLVRVLQGKILDVVVDIRKNSPTFKKIIKIELAADDHQHLLVPKGFAHGFCTLTDNCHVIYKVDNYYSPENNSGIAWNDTTLNIDWPVDSPMLSEQDQKWPSFNKASLF